MRGGSSSVVQKIRRSCTLKQQLSSRSHSTAPLLGQPDEEAAMPKPPSPQLGGFVRSVVRFVAWRDPQTEHSRGT